MNTDLVANSKKGLRVASGDFWFFTAFLVGVALNLWFILSTRLNREEGIISLWLRVKKANLRKQLKE